MSTPAKKNWPLKISTLIVVTACFVVMAGSVLLSQNFKKILTLWGEDVQMTIYLAADISADQHSDLEAELKNSGKVSKISNVTQGQALNEFRAQMASYAPTVDQDEELLKLIPASLQVQLSEDIPISQQMTELTNLAEKIKKSPGVDEVSFGQDWIAKYASLVLAVETSLSILGLVILLAALFVISNVIRASVASRKDEIVVMEMIGATSSMIRKPFLIEGAVLGISASVLGLIMCFGMYIGIKKLLIMQLSFLQLSSHMQFLGTLSIILFVLCGCFLGALASYLCVRRMNTGFAGSRE